MEKRSMNIPLNIFFCVLGKKVMQVWNDLSHKSLLIIVIFG